MAKMAKCDKAWRKQLIARLEHAGGRVKFNPESGVTVATMPCIQGKAKFGRVAVAVCSESDKPKRKMGELLAITNLFDGMSLPVRLENWMENWQDDAYYVFSLRGYL